MGLTALTVVLGGVVGLEGVLKQWRRFALGSIAMGHCAQHDAPPVAAAVYLTAAPHPKSVQGSKPVLGVVHVPVSGKTYFAVVGRGAYVRHNGVTKQVIGLASGCTL